MEGAFIASQRKKTRQAKLLKLIEQNPLATDEQLAQILVVSVSTIRMDRAVLGLPELRERMRSMAQKATSRLRSLKENEVVGDLLELEPDERCDLTVASLLLDEEDELLLLLTLAFRLLDVC